jgi:hypothetical protein
LPILPAAIFYAPEEEVAAAAQAPVMAQAGAAVPAEASVRVAAAGAAATTVIPQVLPEVKAAARLRGTAAQ